MTNRIIHIILSCFSNKTMEIIFFKIYDFNENMKLLNLYETTLPKMFLFFIMLFEKHD
jgi:hypothetical protein